MPRYFIAYRKVEELGQKPEWASFTTESESTLEARGVKERVERRLGLFGEKLVGRVPVFGICLGHQILALALGARTFKLPFGHHGANHPVKDLASGRVEITAQNHGFAVDPDSCPSHGLLVTHVNLNDGTCEGMRHRELPVFSVQYHPEASPGPHDAHYLFQRFVTLMDESRAEVGTRAGTKAGGH